MTQDPNEPASRIGALKDMIDLAPIPLTRAAIDVAPGLSPRIASHVPKGWDAAVAAAIRAIAALSMESGVQIRLAQMKSKFGGLRMYLDIDEDSVGPLEVSDTTPISTRLESSATQGSVRSRARAIISEAERQCSVLCEQCGATGALRSEAGWLRVACGLHGKSED